MVMPRTRLALAVSALAVSTVLPSLAPAEAEPRSDVAVQRLEVLDADLDRARQLDQQGLDVWTDGSQVEVLVHGAWDTDQLARAGVRTRVLDRDVTGANDVDRQREAAAQRRVDVGTAARSGLPSGRVSYRTLGLINAEMRRLARQYPDTAKLIILPERSLLGQRVLGLEISHDVDEASGKPVFLNTGVHHAREWPTAEFVLEFAREVLAGDGADPRATDLLERGRLIAVPVVNVDGYELSREQVLEQKRKNCRVESGVVPTAAECAAAEDGGVDNNRNYPAFWGGPGASAEQQAGNHRGAAPLSEPENRNMSWLASRNQVTVAINNHTPDERLLRAPSSSNEPVPADVEIYDALAQQLGADLGWPAGPWPEIYYEASGTAEQTAYYGAGSFGFTPEATPGFSGGERFHPPYEYVVDQYLGEDFYAGSSIQAAFYTAFEAALDPVSHGVISGTAEPGAALALSRSHSLDSSVQPDGSVLTTDQELSSELTVAADGQVEWHVTPSWRPSQYASDWNREAWTLTCTGADGQPVSQRVEVARGADVAVDLSGCTA